MRCLMMTHMQTAPLSLMTAASSDHCATSATVKSTQRQLTVMLVIICCAAICLQLPYTVLYLLNADKVSLWPEQHGHPTLYANIYLSVKVADVFATANYAVNFVLYCVSGSVFRHGVRRLCRPARRLRRLGGRYAAVEMTRAPTLKPRTTTEHTTIPRGHTTV